MKIQLLETFFLFIVIFHIFKFFSCNLYGFPIKFKVGLRKK
jgi:hypothetical protein